MNITLRPATMNDLSTLRHWDQQYHVLESDPNEEWEWETELQREKPWRQQLIAQVDSRPIGFIQIIDPYEEETHYWGEVPQGMRAIDIWIGEASDLGRGYGSQMMSLALEICFANKSVSAVIIDPLTSNTKAIRFYERMGFKFIEHRVLGVDHCSIYSISRSTWLKNSKYPS